MTEGFNLGQLLGKVGDPSECPQGEVVLEARSCEAVTSSTGKPMLKIKAFIVGGPYEGRSVNETITLVTDNVDALGFFAAKIAAWGASDPELLAQCNGTLAPLAAVIPGKRCKAVLKADTWQNRPRPKIENYLEHVPGGGEAAEPAKGFVAEEVEF